MSDQTTTCNAACNMHTENVGLPAMHSLQLAHAFQLEYVVKPPQGRACASMQHIAAILCQQEQGQTRRIAKVYICRG